MRLTSIALVTALSFTASAATASTYYRWKDSDGVIHYAEKAPQGVNAETISIRAGSPTSEPSAQQNNSQNQAQPAPASPAEKPQPTPEQLAQQRETCSMAQANLKLLQEAGRIRAPDAESGEMSYLSEEQRAAEMTTAKEIIEKSCAE